MNDCSKAEIRDQLPDLLHDRLDAKARAELAAHVDECVDCKDELELLRGVQRTLMTHTPRVDIAYVVGALPKPPARTTQFHPARRRWVGLDWRVAAAVMLLAVGGGSVALLNRVPAADTQRTASVPTDTSAPSANPPAVAKTIASVEAQDAVDDSGPDGRFAGLSDGQLQELLGEIDRLQAVPVTEPEPVTITVDLKPTSPEGA